MERKRIALCGLVVGVGVALLLNQDDPSAFEGTYVQQPNDLSSLLQVATISPEDRLVPPNTSGNSYVPTLQGTQALPLNQYQDSTCYYDDQYPCNYTGGYYYDGLYYYYSPYPYRYYHPQRNRFSNNRFNRFDHGRAPFRSNVRFNKHPSSGMRGGAHMGGGHPGHGGGGHGGGGHGGGGHGGGHGR